MGLTTSREDLGDFPLVGEVEALLLEVLVVELALRCLCSVFFLWTMCADTSGVVGVVVVSKACTVPSSWGGDRHLAFLARFSFSR